MTSEEEQKAIFKVVHEESSRLSLEIAGIIENFSCQEGLIAPVVRLALLKLAGFVFYENGKKGKDFIRKDIDMFYQNLLKIADELEPMPDVVFCESHKTSQ
jgi:hypothetical protein